MVKKNIAILAGGDSREYVISVKSAEQIMGQIDRTRYIPWLVIVRAGKWQVFAGEGQEYPVDLNDFSFTNPMGKVPFEYAFIIIHGTPGEDGKIQAYLDLIKIPYNTCGQLASAITFNKYACKSFLRNFGILTAEALLLRQSKVYDKDKIAEQIGLPCFVKPNNGGSSFGTSKVIKAEDLDEAIALAFREDDEVIIESFIKGIELSCGLVKMKSESYIFPVTEIVPKNDFFDYEAKYTDGMSEEITPARIPDELQKKCMNIASDIYDYLNCRGIVRIDFIALGNQLYFLELNSVPGMSKESIVPKQIRAMGLRVEDILQKVMEDTLNG
jgi:D-alanine-D-alanine ligase